MTSRNFLILTLVIALGSPGPLAAQEWVPLGPDDWNWPSVGQGFNPTLVLDAGGQPVVGSRDFGCGGEFRVRRWNGGKWIELGSNGLPLTWSLSSEMVLDHLGNPVVAGSDPNNGDRISVRRWNGAAWVPVGMDGFSSGEIAVVKLAKDGLGRFVVAYIDDSIDRVCVKRWNGTNWVTLGAEGFSDAGAYGLELALDDAGNPMVTYQAYPNVHLTRVHRWTGSAWELLPLIDLGIGIVNDKAIVVDATGDPVVLITSTVFGNRATVMKWNGSEWVTLGPPGFSVGNISDPGLAVDLQGRPVVIYTDYDEPGTIVRRWDGSAWEVLCTIDPNAGPQHTKMVVDPNGDLVFAFQAWGLGARVCVQRWAGAVWQTLGERGFSYYDAYYTSIATGALGEIVVAYSDEWLGYRTTVQRWNGTSWELVGPPGFSPENAGFTSVALEANGNPVIAYRDTDHGGRTTVQRWNGSTWEVVGMEGFSSGTIKGLDLAIDTNDRPVVTSLLSTSNNEINVVQVQRWDGTSWVDLGAVDPSWRATGGVSLALFRNGDPVVACQDGPNGATLVKRWNGTGWEVMWSGSIFFTPADRQCLAAGPNDELLLAYRDWLNGCAVERWNGYYWESMGTTGLPIEYMADISVAIDPMGVSFLGFQDPNGQATVVRWSGAHWVQVGPQRFTTSFSSFSGPSWLQAAGDGRLVVAYTNGGMYCRSYIPTDQGFPITSDVLNIGPNPNSGESLWISLGGLPTSTENVQAELYDMSGRRISAQLLPVSSGQVNTQMQLPIWLASGMYVASVTAEGSRWSARLIVTK